MRLGELLRSLTFSIDSSKLLRVPDATRCSHWCTWHTIADACRDTWFSCDFDFSLPCQMGSAVDLVKISKSPSKAWGLGLNVLGLQGLFLVIWCAYSRILGIPEALTFSSALTQGLVMEKLLDVGKMMGELSPYTSSSCFRAPTI